MPQTPATQDITQELIKEIAMEIGKETVSYIEYMYPKAIENTSSTFKIAVKNHIYNDIMAALKYTNENDIKTWLAERKTFRRKFMKGVRERRARTEEEWEALRKAEVV